MQKVNNNIYGSIVQNFINQANQKGHGFETDENGHVDMFGMEYDIHNGPRCIRCKYIQCIWCAIRDNVKIPECK